VQTALQGLASIGSGNISVTKTTDTSTDQVWTLTFQGSLAAANQSQLTIDCSNVTTTMLMPPTAVQATDVNGQSGQNEVQVVTLSNATDGTFRLAFGGQTTAPIAYNASAATVDTAFEALQAVDTVTTTGSNGGPWTVTFTGTHANANVAQIQGDAANTQSGSVERTISYTYDVASQLTSATDPDSTYAYTYDYIGRVLTVDNNGTSGVPRVILTSIYDAASNRTRLSATVAGTNDFKNDYTYDNMNRMTQAAQIGNGGNTVANKRANFAYNALSQFTSVERQVKPSSTWNEVATTAFTYDTLNRITGIDHKRSGTSLFTAYSNTYDRMDRITGITSADGTVAYTYDKTSQLTGADYSYQTDETFTWDANGNPSGGSNTVGTNNRLTSDGTYNYTYDDEGNQTRRTKISDSSYTDYTWDHRNRLTNVTNKTSGGTSTMSADYAYDVYDRRIKKVVDADGAGGGGSVTTRYVYEDEGITRVVLQFDGSNNITHRYLHGPAVDQLLAHEDSSNALLWSLADNIGTVRDLINNSGVTQNHLKYGAFGNVTNESAAAVDFLMGFAGMDRDEETGASYSWHRPTANGRWLTPDPDGFAAGDANLTRYVHNDPIGSMDPTGLKDTDAENDGIFGDLWLLINGMYSRRVQLNNQLAAVQMRNRDPGQVAADFRQIQMRNAQAAQAAARVGTTGAVQFNASAGLFLSPTGPTGGITAGATTQATRVVRFGNDARQLSHAMRHLAPAGLDSAAVQAAIQADLSANAAAIQAGLNIRHVTVAGQELQYNAYLFEDGIINVGRINLP
jgi:RHS repeat-associated protein